MNYIVLVKQVPDIANIPEDAWDRERGTLIRAKLDNVLNPLDLHALTFAYQLEKTLGGEDSKILCLTMGPPQAKEVLLDSISRGADDGILLTDKLFAGADTVATAYALAQAIRKIETEIFKSNDYMILSGMQSVDGDTAQVPSQIAEELGIEQIAYARSFKKSDGRIHFTRIGPVGTEIVAPRSFPLLLTITACTETLYRTFERSRKARGKKLFHWTAADVQADPQRIGLKGSRTQVYRIYSPTEERKKNCQLARSPQELVQWITERYGKPPASGAEVSGASYSLTGKTPSYRGEIWIFAEQEQGAIRPVVLELITEARLLAAPLGEKVGAVLLGHQVRSLAQDLIAQGADKVYWAEDPALENYLPTPYKKTIASLVKEHQPQIMLFGATPLGRELAPRVAYSTSSGLTADCTKLEIDDFERGAVKLFAILKQTRPALGGNIMATIMTKDARTQMATVRPGVMKAGRPDSSRQGEILEVAPGITPQDIRTEIIAIESFGAQKTLAEADILVSGGRGLGTKANYDQTIRPLAEALKGVLPGHIDISASRSAVEEGFIGHDHQVGQTGQTVQPKLYIAVAISGAVQHISGMQNSDLIVAINKDPHARIFNYADLGLVGEYQGIIPPMLEEFRRRKA